MAETGVEAMPQSTALETAGEREMRLEALRFRSVAVIAAVVCAIAAAGEALALWVALGKLRSISESLGAPLPGLPGVVVATNPVFVCAWFILLAVAVFAVFAWLAKRYWIGLLFVPVMLYGIIGGELANWLAAASLSAIQNIS